MVCKALFAADLDGFPPSRIGRIFTLPLWAFHVAGDDCPHVGPVCLSEKIGSHRRPRDFVLNAVTCCRFERTRETASATIKKLLLIRKPEVAFKALFVVQPRKKIRPVGKSHQRNFPAKHLSDFVWWSRLSGNTKNMFEICALPSIFVFFSRAENSKWSC
jgi:hypothetical protein